MQMSPTEAEEAVQCALLEGYRLIDTAQLFRNEEAVGEPKAGGMLRAVSGS